MSDQPTYLKLLRGIANAESDAHCYLSAWRDTTANPDVRSVLTTVASREGEHGMSFAKRVIEFQCLAGRFSCFGHVSTLKREKRHFGIDLGKPCVSRRIAGIDRYGLIKTLNRFLKKLRCPPHEV